MPHVADTYTAKVTLEISAPVERVWEALTRPDLIKHYLYGTEVTTDWKVGSPIVYRGEWKGQRYEDKGKILELVPGRRFSSTYWSALSGVADKPENYQVVTYDLAPHSHGTSLTLLQDNIRTEAARAESEQNWRMVLEALKKLVEKI